MPNNVKFLIIGSGYISKEYLKILHHKKYSCTIVGRGEKNIREIQKDFPSFEYHHGGLKQYLDSHEIKSFTHCLNLVNIEYLYQTTSLLLDHGAKNILLEKPGDVAIKNLKTLSLKAKKHDASICIAYNRRFFDSINTLEKLVKEEGGIQTLHFEFTEWLHRIDLNKFSDEILKKWITANSSHVIDTAFYLIGEPTEIYPIIKGKGSISWHPSGSVFLGAGVSENEIPFTYNSNWKSAGRWSIEVFTNEKRYFLRPMEELYYQNLGEVKINKIELNVPEDSNFKPGLEGVLESFLYQKDSKLIPIDQQIKNIETYNKIGAY